MAAPAAAQADRAGFYAARKASEPGAAPTKKDLTAATAPASVAIGRDEPSSRRRCSGCRRTTARSSSSRSAREREAVLTQIKEANAKRDAALKAAPKPPAAAPASFDAKVMDSLKKAGAAKGISY